jgi:hypothetical protein
MKSVVRNVNCVITVFCTLAWAWCKLHNILECSLLDLQYKYERQNLHLHIILHKEFEQNSQVQFLFQRFQILQIYYCYTVVLFFRTHYYLSSDTAHVKRVVHNLKFSHCCHIWITDLQTTFQTQHASTLTIHLHTTFYTPNITVLFVIVNKTKAKEKLHSCHIVILQPTKMLPNLKVYSFR